MPRPLAVLALLPALIGSLASACDQAPKGPKKSHAEQEAESYASASDKTLDAYQAVFERLATRVRGDTYEHLACPADLTTKLDNGIWLNADTIALTEGALRWFAETPRETSSAAETPVPWAQGAEGYLNDFGLAAPDILGLDGGRLAYLRDARLFEQFGPTKDRTVGLLKLDVIHRFDTEHRKAPDYVLLLRSVELVEPKAPDQIARTKDELVMDKFSRDLQAKNDPSGLNTAALEAALNPPPTHSETTFKGGKLKGVLEVYDASTGTRLCGHALDTKNSDKISSYYSGVRAVHDDLADNLVDAANAAFSTPLRKVHRAEAK